MNVNDLHISVIEPIHPAIERVKAILFRPFNLIRWFTIGFCAWLGQLGQGGFNFNFNYHTDAASVKQNLPQYKEFVISHLPWIIGGAFLVLIIIILLWLVLFWLSSRGKFMFLYCIAQNKAQVTHPWKAYSALGNSLFVFRFAFSLISLIWMVCCSGLIILFIILMRNHSIARAGSIIGIAATSAMLVISGIIIALVMKLLNDFVVPVMYVFSCRCVEAWGIFWRILKNRPGVFVLYLLFQVVIGLAIGMIVIVAGLMTCCCACCIAALPYIGTVLLLPVSVFMRSYSLYFLSQFGPAYDAFKAEVQIKIE